MIPLSRSEYSPPSMTLATTKKQTSQPIDVTSTFDMLRRQTVVVTEPSSKHCAPADTPSPEQWQLANNIGAIECVYWLPGIAATSDRS